MFRSLILLVVLGLAACARPTMAPVDYRITPLLERVLREVDSVTSPGPQPANLYVVQRGDTLPRIAQRYGLDTVRLATANGMQPPYNLRVGQRLALPPLVTEPTVAVASLPVATVEVEPLGDGAKREQPAPRAPARAAIDERTPQPATRAAPAPSPKTEAPPAKAAALPQSPPAAAPDPGGKPPPRTASRLLWPVDGPIKVGFGPQGGGLQNDGIDIRAAKGTPFRAAEDGIVIYVGSEVRGFGNLLLVRHGDNLVTAYAHADQIHVKKGDRVKRGQVVGRVGSTGLTGEPRLHFEVRKGTDPVDPIGHLEARDRRMADRG